MTSSVDMRAWSPPPDPIKPSCPYLPGFTVDIQSHIPPAPFGNKFYGMGARSPIPSSSLKTVTQSQLVTTHPPLETTSPAKPRKLRLTITKTIAIGNARGPQVVVCKVEPRDGESPFLAVAKIYDALYYSFCDNDVSLPVNVPRAADQDYSREAAAYERLRQEGQTGSFAPQYFGSWTFTLPIGSNGQRPVRMILIEYLEGVSIMDQYTQNSSVRDAEPDAFHLAEEYRLEVLARILDGAVRLMHVGVDQADLAPRNVILVPQPAVDFKLPRVVIVDYNISTVHSLNWSKKDDTEDSPLPRNPMAVYWFSQLVDFKGWSPAPWISAPRLFQEWLTGRFGGAESSKYAPIRKRLEFMELDSNVTGRET